MILILPKRIGPMDTLSEIRIVVQAGSTKEVFDIELVIPVAGFLTQYADEGLRGLSPIQEGGRLLLYDSIRLGNEMVEIMLTLHQGARESLFRIVGELSGLLLSTHIRACLEVDHERYEAEVENGRVEFSDIPLSGDVSSISVRLTTSD
jgi:hypothetical protein